MAPLDVFGTPEQPTTGPEQRCDLKPSSRSLALYLKSSQVDEFERELAVQLREVRTPAFEDWVFRNAAAANGMTMPELVAALADWDPVTKQRRTQRSDEKKRVERMVKEARLALAERLAKGVLRRRQKRLAKAADHIE